MVAEAWYGITGPLGNDRHHRFRQYRPVLAILRGHLLDAHACGKDMIDAVLIGHNRVMNHRRISREGHCLSWLLLPVCH